MSDETLQEVSFEQLLGALAQVGALSGDNAQQLLARQDAQRKQLMVKRLQRGEGERRAGGDVITPLDLLLSCRPRSAAGRPLSEDRITEVYAKLVGLPYVKLDPLKLNAELITSFFSRPFARQHSLLAIDDDGARLRIATANPFARWALDTVAKVAGKPLELVIASKSDLQRLISEFYGFRRSVKNAEQTLNRGVDIGNLEQLMRMKSEREIEASDQHLVHAVEYLLSYAFQQRASDIHIEPKRDESIVRYRIDGSLHEVNRLPKVVHAAVVNRIKTLARLDIGEKRRPQDGRIKTEYEGKAVEIRVSTLAVAFGEKVVLRIFDPDMAEGDLTGLGFFERDLAVFQRLIARPNGIVLLTGPTGSGKTTTLYTALRSLATDSINISTIEDPIEMVFEHINQTALVPSIGLGFAELLRTLLRQDPDVIMVGEIRDLDTARYAVQAALTGHLVFSTLHTNDAAGAVTRLLDLGVESFLLASTLTGLVAQRLVKRVCSECAEDVLLGPEQLSALGAALSALGTALSAEQRGGVRVRKGTGCVDCRHTGYRGRSAIYELLEVNEAARQLIMGRCNAGQLKKQAVADGMTTLREAAVRKMIEGVTSYEQVLAVT